MKSEIGEEEKEEKPDPKSDPMTGKEDKEVATLQLTPMTSQLDLNPESSMQDINYREEYNEEQAYIDSRQNKLKDQLIKTDTSLLNKNLFFILLILIVFMLFFGVHIQQLLQFYKNYETSTEIASTLAQRITSLKYPSLLVKHDLANNELEYIIDDHADYGFQYYYNTSQRIESWLQRFLKNKNEYPQYHRFMVTSQNLKIKNTQNNCLHFF